MRYKSDDLNLLYTRYTIKIFVKERKQVLVTRVVSRELAELEQGRKSRGQEASKAAECAIPAGGLKEVAEPHKTLAPTMILLCLKLT